MFKQFIIFMLTLGFSVSVLAQSSAAPSSTVYKCTDAHGKITYANVPCEGQREVLPEWKLQGTVIPAPATSASSSSTAKSSPSETDASSVSSLSKMGESITDKIGEVGDKLGESWQKMFQEKQQQTPSPEMDIPKE